MPQAYEARELPDCSTPRKEGAEGFTPPCPKVHQLPVLLGGAGARGSPVVRERTSRILIRAKVHQLRSKLNVLGSSSDGAIHRANHRLDQKVLGKRSERCGKVSASGRKIGGVVSRLRSAAVSNTRLASSAAASIAEPAALAPLALMRYVPKVPGAAVVAKSLFWIHTLRRCPPARQRKKFSTSPVARPVPAGTRILPTMFTMPLPPTSVGPKTVFHTLLLKVAIVQFLLVD